MEELHNKILKQYGHRIIMSEDAARVSKLYQNILKEFEIKTIMETYNLDQEEAEVMYVLGERLVQEQYRHTTGEETR